MSMYLRAFKVLPFPFALCVTTTWRAVTFVLVAFTEAADRFGGSKVTPGEKKHVIKKEEKKRARELMVKEQKDIQ